MFAEHFPCARPCAKPSSTQSRSSIALLRKGGKGLCVSQPWLRYPRGIATPNTRRLTATACIFWFVALPGSGPGHMSLNLLGPVFPGMFLSWSQEKSGQEGTAEGLGSGHPPFSASAHVPVAKASHRAKSTVEGLGGTGERPGRGCRRSSLTGREELGAIILSTASPPSTCDRFSFHDLVT